MDPTIEALTIHPAAWAALLQGLAEGMAYGAAAIGSVLVVAVVSAVSLDGRRSAEPTATSTVRELSVIVPIVRGPQRVTRARRRRRVCQRAQGPWRVIARQPEWVG